jgi:alpha-D-xyloside xylohydrolase
MVPFTWQFGKQTQDAIVDSAIKLRYALLPYTYSGFARVMTESYTMQRALAFDFGDARSQTTSDQFMFGDCLLVAPLLDDSSSRLVYLPQVPAIPKGTGAWYGFWDGKLYAPAAAENVSAPLLRIPLFAKRGSILAVGPALQHTGEKPTDPMEIRVFDGTSASFTLYEDDGVSSDFTRSSTIAINWSETKQELTLGPLKGIGFPAMLVNRTFNLVRVRIGHGVGYGQTAAPDKSIAYDGHEVSVKLPA